MKGSNKTAPGIFQHSSKQKNWLSTSLWGIAALLVGLALYLGWHTRGQPLAFGDRIRAVAHSPGFSLLPQDTIAGDSLSNAGFALQDPATTHEMNFISRRATLHTTIPTRPRQEVQNYRVDQGDSVFEIAAHFNIKPETILWANYDLLKDNPDLISIGMELNIPPVDGVLYQWQSGDSLEEITGRFEADPQSILNWPGNHLDLTNPKIEAGALIMLPGGHREFRQWLIPTIPRGAAGVSKAVYGEGACTGSYDGAVGSGAFIWPADNHSLSGNDYWSGHLGIDVAIGEGGRIYATDGGVVVFAGWSTGGYGNTVIIDHGNGYQTLYAHLSKVSTSCGRSVSQGAVIGYAGSTGNSTGPHLHFEVRYLGGFINPWYVLP